MKKNNNNIFMPIEKSQILKKILASGMLFLSVSSYSDCMNNDFGWVDNKPLVLAKGMFTPGQEMTLQNFAEKQLLFHKEKQGELRSQIQFKQEQLDKLEYQAKCQRVELESQARLQQLKLDIAESQVKYQRVELGSQEKLQQQRLGEAEFQKQEYKILRGEYETAKRCHAKKLAQQQQKYKKQLKCRNNIIKCLPYAFGAAIAGGIHPLFSWIGKEHFGMDTETIQENVQKLQLLSLGAAMCGGKVHKYYNAPMPVMIGEHDSLLGVIIHGMLNVSLQVSNTIILEQVQYIWGGKVDRFKKNDKHVAKTTRKFSKSIRLFMEWSLWHVEKHFMNKFLFSP